MGIGDIIEKIFGLIVELWPIEVIEYYNRGVRLRWGERRMMRDRKLRWHWRKPLSFFEYGEYYVEPILEPGRHWKIPYIDSINSIMVKTKTMNISAQTITTKDWKSVVVESVVKYEIEDVAIALLEVNTPIDAVNDMTKGIIRDLIIERDWKDCNNSEIGKLIKDRARREAKKWGVKILDVTIESLAEVPSLRIFSGQEKNLLNML